MFNYGRLEVKSIASENGFHVNSTEKVLRLCEVLNFINGSLIGDYLVLKGGTAINFCLLGLKRLSIDIDFDFSLDVSKEEMFEKREIIKNEIVSYMTNNGYKLNNRSKYVHSLDSFVFNYSTTAGSTDALKIEINYSDRIHVLEFKKETISLKLGEKIDVNRLANEELIGSKINALISRTTPRDVYDVYNILHDDICDLGLTKKIAIFYLLVSRDIPINFQELIDNCISRISSMNYYILKKTVIPLLNRKENLDIEEMKSYVSENIKRIFELTDEEKLVIEKFNNKEFDQKALFGDLVKKDLSKHPLIIWKYSLIK